MTFVSYFSALFLILRLFQVVQIDGLVIMKLIKHCHELEASTSGSGIAQVILRDLFKAD